VYKRLEVIKIFYTITLYTLGLPGVWC